MTPKQVWSALSDGRKEELLSAYRAVNVEDGLDWWDGIYEMFVEDCKSKGIKVGANKRTTRTGYVYYDYDISFSGFWSQGDGACFEGSVAHWPQVLNSLNMLHLMHVASENDWRFSSSTSHRGNNCMSFSSDFSLPENPFDEDEQILQYDAWNIGQPTDTDLGTLELALQKTFDDLASKLYRDLEAEHDYLTSDECITEYILDHVEIEEMIGDEEIELPEGPAEVDPRQLELAF